MQQIIKAIQRAKNRNYNIAIIGLGYVGIPLAEAFTHRGIEVLGYDIDQTRVDMLNASKSVLGHFDDARISGMVSSKLFEATTDEKRLGDASAILICVPTPLDVHNHPDLSHVKSACEMISNNLRPGQLIVLESTTYPGTTEEVMKPILEKSGLKAGEDFGLAYSPEREDPGNIDFETSTIPKLIGAETQEERELADLIYRNVVSTILVSSTRVAEAAKLMENIFRWVNIGLVNELKTVFDGMGIDVHEVVDAAKSKPFGFMAFRPGPGVGGHCIPIDPYYLTWKAREYGHSTRFIELAGEVNRNMPQRVVSRLSEVLDQKYSKPLNGARILLLGIAYKRDVDDMRESPSMVLWRIMDEAGADVEYFDAHVPEVPMTREFPEYAGRKSIALTGQAIGAFDAVLIATDHRSVDYASVVDKAMLTIDTRNVTGDLDPKLREKVISA